ncbi:methyltransferase, TIGR04325 family [Candidatus Methylopumilus universalis]|uniref:methyltransferase, TIGR04325 family n=1 Tax=Candidatus Methylopumilus universalis TaxID=2588536 RepID=UPI001123ABC6|nr:methyltransferase, TIGR04325 family [Candidatus Methylopumilus universalis]QDC47510.1 methyltransferase, TIGR04325 family [Candidatus Methylopumilus universalis]QDC72043.1 methyltransferase, TIGR04325 family [Candidatus Methylopumilus universalis]
MNGSLKSNLKDWLPPIFLKGFQRIFKQNIWFEGEFDTWEKAVSKCSGYHADNILNKVLEATLKVVRNEAVYERDSVLFSEIKYSWPVTAALMLAAARSKGKLNVLDFGGALGSSYFQNRKFIKSIPSIKWSVVEQPNFVEAGIKYIQDDILRFYSSIKRCVKVNRPNVILLSSALQYIQNPNHVLLELLRMESDIIIIDRTPFYNSNKKASVKIQNVPASIYPASYPCWFFSLQDFIAEIESHGYKQIERFSSLDKLSNNAVWLGFIFIKINNDEI